MTDVLGKEVKVGDKVAFINSPYRELRIGTITKVCAKRVTVDNLYTQRSSHMICKVDV